jgi:hypothetical protein
MVAPQQKPLHDVQLNLSFLEPRWDKMRKFAVWLGKDTEVTDLQLCFSQIKGDMMRLLAEALSINCSVEILRLGGCDIHAAGADHLAYVLRKNQTLHALGLSHNHLGAEGVAHLAEALASNGVLQKLDLGSNMIGEHGAACLAAALTENHTLTGLRLHGNLLRDNGAQVIATALEQNRGLCDLCLSCNCITDTGAVHLAGALHHNHVLLRLDMSHNYIRDSGAKALVDAWQSCSLSMLCLASNPTEIVPDNMRYSDSTMIASLPALETDAQQTEQTLHHDRKLRPYVGDLASIKLDGWSLGDSLKPAHRLRAEKGICMNVPALRVDSFKKGSGDDRHRVNLLMGGKPGYKKRKDMKSEISRLPTTAEDSCRRSTLGLSRCQPSGACVASRRGALQSSRPQSAPAVRRSATSPSLTSAEPSLTQIDARLWFSGPCEIARPNSLQNLRGTSTRRRSFPCISERASCISARAFLLVDSKSFMHQ